MVRQTNNNQKAIKRVRTPFALPLCILCLCLYTGIALPGESYIIGIAANFTTKKNLYALKPLTYTTGYLKNDVRVDCQGIQADRSDRIDSLHGQSPVSQQREVSKIKIKLAENKLTIENLERDGLLEVYNIMGTKVYARRVQAGTSTHILPLPKGYYIIKIGKFSRKIAVK